MNPQTHRRLAILLCLVCLSIPLPDHSVRAEQLPLVVIVSTGGTIASKTDAGGGAVPALTGEALAAGVPGLDKAARIEVIDLYKIDSSRMTTANWSHLGRTVSQTLSREDVDGVVVTHGTDTMAQGAFFLDCILKSDKPVVFTGAMRDASSPGAEGPYNLLNAVIAAASPRARDWGVVVCLNDYINSAWWVMKTETTNVQTFESGRHGYLGQVINGRVYRWAASPPHPRLPLGDSLPKCPLITTFPDDDGFLIRQAINRGVRGLVIEAPGAGNVNAQVFEAVKEALAKETVVVITSRVPHGGVWPAYGGPGGGATLEKSGCILGGDLPGPKARLLLMLALAQGVQGQDLADLFSRKEPEQ